MYWRYDQFDQYTTRNLLQYLNMFIARVLVSAVFMPQRTIHNLGSNILVAYSHTVTFNTPSKLNDQRPKNMEMDIFSQENWFAQDLNL